MRAVVLILLQFLLSACSHAPRPSPPPDLDSNLQLCVHGLEQRCRSSHQIAELLRDPKIEITAAGATPGGQQGAFLLNLRHPSGTVFSAKWRTEEAQTLLGNFSRPRREVVAYHLQKIFLESSDYVIPPTVSHCFPIDQYRKFVEKAVEPTWKEIPCVFGFLSFWLPDVETVAKDDESTFIQPRLFSEERFENDVTYARAVSALNIITFAAEHGDSHARQFVVAEKPFHVWSVDHSISLTAVKNPMALLREDWSKMKVPQLPADMAARIAQLKRSDIDRLGLIEVLREEGNGLIAEAAPPAPHEDIAIVHKNHKVYVGTTMAERDLIWGKVQDLQADLSSGELTVMR